MRWVRRFASTQRAVKPLACSRRHRGFMQRPWKAADSSDTAEWLKAIDKSLGVAIEATKRPDYFNPLMPTKDAKGDSSGLISALLR